MKNSTIGLFLVQPVGFHTKFQYPVKMFEYMGNSLPVIASNFPGIARIINKETCGLLVDPTNTEEIAESIVYLLEHSVEAEKMGDNGRKAILGKYNWENEEKKLLNVYDKILQK